MAHPQYDEAGVRAIIGEVTEYVRTERERFYSIASPISLDRRTVFAPFFSDRILAKARLYLGGLGTVPDPPFAARARERGFRNMPNYSHLGEITFNDVIVLQTQMTDRLLFHALVHCVQYDQLGIERYVERYVRQFVRTGIHVLVPFEENAFQLDQRFAQSPKTVFQVEDEVRRMIDQDKY